MQHDQIRPASETDFVPLRERLASQRECKQSKDQSETFHVEASMPA